MQKQNPPGLLIRFLLYPLLYTTQTAAEGIVVGIGVLLIYPFLAILSDLLDQKSKKIESVYLISFLGVLLGSLYILIIGMIDWELYERLKFIFPVSMTASTLLLCWFDHSENEPSHFLEALITSFFIVLFSCLRDAYAHGSLDLRFGGFGVLYSFGMDAAFKLKEVQLGSWIKDLKLSPLQSTAMTFWGVMILLSILNSFKSKQSQDK